MGHGTPRLKQVRSWGLSSGRSGATAAMGAACKLAPHDHDQPAGALTAGTVWAAFLNGGRNACAPTSTITPASSVPRSHVQPVGHSLHRRRVMGSEIDQDHRRCTRSARDNTGTFLHSSTAAAALRMYFLHPGASSSTRVGNVRSAPAAAAAGASETTATAAVETATAASSS